MLSCEWQCAFSHLFLVHVFARSSSCGDIQRLCRGGRINSGQLPRRSPRQTQDATTSAFLPGPELPGKCNTLLCKAFSLRLFFFPLVAHLSMGRDRGRPWLSSHRLSASCPPGQALTPASESPRTEPRELSYRSGLTVAATMIGTLSCRYLSWDLAHGAVWCEPLQSRAKQLSLSTPPPFPSPPISGHAKLASTANRTLPSAAQRSGPDTTLLCRRTTETRPIASQPRFLPSQQASQPASRTERQTDRQTEKRSSIPSLSLPPPPLPPFLASHSAAFPFFLPRRQSRSRSQCLPTYSIVLHVVTTSLLYCTRSMPPPWPSRCASSSPPPCRSSGRPRARPLKTATSVTHSTCRDQDAK